MQSALFISRASARLARESRLEMFALNLVLLVLSNAHRQGTFIGYM